MTTDKTRTTSNQNPTRLHHLTPIKSKLKRETNTQQSKHRFQAAATRNADS
jgi:hypothetical protein